MNQIKLFLNKTPSYCKNSGSTFSSYSMTNSSAIPPQPQLRNWKVSPWIPPSYHKRLQAQVSRRHQYRLLRWSIPPLLYPPRRRSRWLRGRVMLRRWERGWEGPSRRLGRDRCRGERGRRRRVRRGRGCLRGRRGLLRLALVIGRRVLYRAGRESFDRIYFCFLPLSSIRSVLLCGIIHVEFDSRYFLHANQLQCIKFLPLSRSPGLEFSDNDDLNDMCCSAP